MKNWVNYLNQKMAEEESIAFENFGVCFANNPALFSRDMLHLNKIGSSRFGYMLNRFGSKIASKYLSETGNHNREM